MGYRILRDFLRQSHRDDDEGSREKGGNVLEHSIVARDWGFLATASAFVPHPGFHSGFDSIFSFFVGGWWTEEKVIQSAGSATYVVGKRKKIHSVRFSPHIPRVIYEEEKEGSFEQKSNHLRIAIRMGKHFNDSKSRRHGKMFETVSQTTHTRRMGEIKGGSRRGCRTIVSSWVLLSFCPPRRLSLSLLEKRASSQLTRISNGRHKGI